MAPRFTGSSVPVADCRQAEALCIRPCGRQKPVGEGVHELRLAFGPGYRIYYMWRDTTLVLLLIGGDKDSQARDIAKAKELAREADNGIDDDAL